MKEGVIKIPRQRENNHYGFKAFFERNGNFVFEKAQLNGNNILKGQVIHLFQKQEEMDKLRQIGRDKAILNNNKKNMKKELQKKMNFRNA